MGAVVLKIAHRFGLINYKPLHTCLRMALEAAPPIKCLADTLVDLGSWFRLVVCKLKPFK
jgi:hypothetical protein